MFLSTHPMAITKSSVGPSMDPTGRVPFSFLLPNHCTRPSQPQHIPFVNPTFHSFVKLSVLRDHLAAPCLRHRFLPILTPPSLACPTPISHRLSHPHPPCLCFPVSSLFLTKSKHQSLVSSSPIFFDSSSLRPLVIAAIWAPVTPCAPPITWLQKSSRLKNRIYNFALHPRPI
ncbi:hypothetical protein BDN70DRAFT_993610, partial [Pholiota conissans]